VNNVFVKYTGQKPTLKVPFPCPLTSLSMKEAEIEFQRGKPTQISAEYAAQLLKAAPDTFKKVEDDDAPRVTPKAR
jgi:hypothetical protein